MKKFILGSALVISNAIISQVITINASECGMHIKAGNVSYENVLTSPEVVIEPRSTNTTYILNLQDSTAKFYHYNQILSMAKIVDINQTKNIIELTMLDHDINGNIVYTYMHINQKQKQVYFYWYNTIADVTKVETKTKFSLDIR